MKFKILICLLLCFMISCKSTDGDLTDKDNICKLYQQMDSDDQKYRAMMGTDVFFKILDSIKVSEGITRDIYVSFSTEKQREYGKRARLIADKKPVNQKKNDSLMNLQKTVDNKNIELLFKIIEKNKGIPDFNTLPCKRGYGAVFMHADDKYFPRLKVIIEDEFKAGRIGEAEYNYMQWHMGGRKADQFQNIKVAN